MKKRLSTAVNLKGKEVKQMKKAKFFLLTVMMMMSMLVIQGTAIAAPQIGFDPTGTATYTTYADLWTSLTDTGLSVGFNSTRTDTNPVSIAINGGAPLGGAYNTTFILQAALGAMSVNGGVVTPTGLNPTGATPGFELTFETVIPETVTQQFALGGSGFAHFVSGESTSALLNLYIDQLTGSTDPTKHNPGNTSPPPAAGTVSGYGDDDSIGAILTAHLLSATADFNATIAGVLGTGSFNARFIIDSVNTKYIDVATGTIFDIEETGTLNVPPFYFPANMWNGTPVPTTANSINGIPLKYDGSASFSTIPEPSTLLLLGMGLLGLAGLGRKRFKK